MIPTTVARVRKVLGVAVVVTLLAAVPTAAVLIHERPSTSPAAQGDDVAPALLPAASPRAEQASPTARVNGRQVGFSTGFSIVDDSPAAQRRQFAQMRALGVRRVRLDIGWARVQQSPTRFDWDDTDQVVRAARASGLKVLGVLAYEPSWARSTDASGQRADVDPAAFAAFAARAAKRYDGKVSDWELWNEPNLDGFWGTDPDPVAYARLVEAAATQIRSVVPEARVVVGALSPAVDADDGSQISPETFLREFYANVSSLALFDAVSVHPYSYPAMPDGKEEWNTFFKLPELHDIMVRAGDGSTRLWLTEYGAPTGKSDRAVRARTQARMMVTALHQARGLDYVGPVFLYSYRDSDRDKKDPEANFGVTRYGGQPKAAYWALRRALRPGKAAPVAAGG